MIKAIFIKTACSQKALFCFWGIVFFFLFPLSCFPIQPQVCNLSQTNFFFIGREEQLKMIDLFFKKGDKIVLTLTGGPGFGKTQIAKKYAHTFHHNYDFIWWIDTQQDIPNQFEKLALALNTLLPSTEQIMPSKLSKDVLVDTVKNTLRLKKIRYLLIFDNAQTYTQVDKFIPSIHFPSDKHVLLTSRNANIWVDKIDIGKFKREESLSMIKAALPKEKKEEMVRLADALSDYPLGFSLALSFIKSHPTVTIDKYIAMYFKRSLKEREKAPSALLDHYPRDALSALEISLRYIEEESKDSLQALFFMSLLNSKDIPESYIESWLKKEKSSLTADDAIKHVYDQCLIGVSETTEFDANKKLTGPVGQERMHYLSIHDLIHQLINEEIDIEAKKQLIEKASLVMLETFSGTVEGFVKRILDEPVHLLHAQKLCENARAINYVSPNLLKLKACIFQCLIAPIRDFEKAKVYLEEIEEDFNTGLELEPYYKAIFKMSKGFFECIYNVNYDEAIRNMSEGLTLLDPFKDHNDGKLRAIANLAQYYTLRGEPDVAEEMINKGKSLFNDANSAEYKTFFIWAWSLVLTDQGKYEEAIKVLNKAKGFPHSFPVFEQGLLQQRTLSYIKLGKIKEAALALKQFEKAIEEFFQGKSKMALGSVWEYKSLILLHKQKHIFEVFGYLGQALNLYKEFFRHDKKHRLQARAHLTMGKAHKVGKKYEKALQEYLLSEEIYNMILKEKKIDDVSDLYTELAILGTNLKDDGITHRYLTSHIDTFGIDHPRTEKILDHLDRLKLAVPN